MPITPFHFGPGLLLKAAAPRAVSFTAFAVANVAIDVESVLNLLARRHPVHATLHMLPVAAAVGVLAGLLVAGVGRLVKRTTPEWRVGPAVLGGLLGGVTHPLLDGLMHADIRPFLPFTNQNPLLELVSLGALHAACVMAGATGVLWLVLRSQMATPTEAPADDPRP